MTDRTINLDIHAFAAAADAMGRREHTLNVTSGATVSDAWLALVKACPELKTLEDTIAFACNDRLVTRQAKLEDGDTLALLPPVSGG
ncbi:MAG: MoaD/ThiS family protein [Planctomycetota bacterium]|nr:MoaD/ThiS family protein [Planctomycetota bacterium]